jgi:hypothetical protein
MIFKIVSPKNLAKKIGVFDWKQRQILKKCDDNIGIEEIRHFLPKIGKNR